jgi:porin
MKELLCLATGLLLMSETAFAQSLKFGLSNTTDILSNMQGGLKTGTQVLNKSDIKIDYAAAEDGWPGLNLFTHLQWTHKNDFSATHVGDAQVVSNIDTAEGLRVMEAWVSRDLSDNAGLKFGIVDLNTEFDVQSFGGLFLNASNGIGPDYSQSGANGPSIFAATGLAVVGWWQANEQWLFKAGVFEGEPGNASRPGRTQINLTGSEGALLTFETRYRLSDTVTLGAGFWHYTAGFAPIGAPGIAHGNNGFYGIAEATLWGDPEGESLNGWIRAGLANARINPIRSYVGGGLLYTAPFGRADDQVGIAISHVGFGAPARLAGGLEESETAIEISYGFALNEWAVIQPDFQYIANPSGDPTLRDAVVGGVRVSLSWP